MEATEDAFNLLSELLAHPRNRGKLRGASGRALVCDKTAGAVQISVRIEGGRVMESRWRACGEPALRAVASFVCVCMEGLEVETAIRRLGVEDVARTLRLPPDGRRCVQLVVAAMLEAIQDHRRRHGHFHLYGRASS